MFLIERAQLMATIDSHLRDLQAKAAASGDPYEQGLLHGKQKGIEDLKELIWNSARYQYRGSDTDIGSRMIEG